tara:strand:- start:164 stop:1141 length:978 start_codon:yes stop_codon:yes gene_type:complete
MTREEIVELLSPFLKFSNIVSAENISAHCPFHKGGQERKPSFYVYVGTPTRDKHVGASFCHTCGEGWSLPALLRKLKVGRLVISDVKKRLDEISPAQKGSRLARLELDLTVLPEAILGAFEYLPKPLLDDGFSKSLLVEHEVGFDRTSKRIIFPIRNHKGDLVGLSGRTVVDDYPRYKIYRSELHGVSPGYEFNKGRVLWGLDKFYQTRMNTKTDLPVILCEGFKAALWVIQQGYPHTAAILGTHLTDTQRALIQRVTNTLILFLDNDQAGKKATEKIIKSLEGVDVRIANYRTTEEVSPDDLNKIQVLHAVETAKTSLSWRNRN